MSVEKQRQQRENELATKCWVPQAGSSGMPESNENKPEEYLIMISMSFFCGRGAFISAS